MSPLRSTLLHGMGYSPITNSHGTMNFRLELETLEEGKSIKLDCWGHL